MDIVASLQRVQLPADTHTHCHMLFLEYPATSLITSHPTHSQNFRLQPPEDAPYREMPDISKYSLQERGLDYFVRYDVSQRYIEGNPTLDVANLTSAINQLSSCGGRSVLEAVTISDNQLGEEGYVFRLSTLWHGSGARQTHLFRLNEAQWRQISTLAEAKPWSSLLLDLFSRASDRAYFHVQRQLHATQYLSTDAPRWDCHSNSTANELLALNMRRVRRRGTMVCLEPIRDLWGENTERFTVRLPCEHEMTTSIKSLKSLSKAQCIDASCPTCGRNIMQERDIIHAEHSLERRRRQRAAADEILWNRVITENPRLVINMHVSGRILSHALCHALRSMQVPELVTPRALCPAWSPEASAALYKILTAYEAESSGIQGTMEVMYELLMTFVDIAVQELSFRTTGFSVLSTFPGWTAFSCKWIERTVKLATMAGYLGEDIWAVFGEEPGEDLCVDEACREVDDLEALVDGITL